MANSINIGLYTILGYYGQSHIYYYLQGMDYDQQSTLPLYLLHGFQPAKGAA